jgi:hypothetical protein
LVLFIYGMVIDQHSAANFVPVNTADNWLHLALAIGMIALGACCPAPTPVPALRWTAGPRPDLEGCPRARLALRARGYVSDLPARQ